MVLIAELNHDTLIAVFCHLSIPDIFAARLACKRFEEISRLLIVWRRIHQHHIMSSGAPFPRYPPLDDHNAAALEEACVRAFHLGRFWRNQMTDNQANKSIQTSLGIHTKSFEASGTEGIAVSEVRFLPGTNGTRFVTTSKGIWSTLIFWDISSNTPNELARWTCQGAIFRGFIVNDQPGAGGDVAISISRDGECRIIILVLSVDQACVNEVATLYTADVPTAFSSNVLARSDAVSRTTLTDISSGQDICALESGSATIAPGLGLPGMLNNACTQVIMLKQYVFVVRARTFELFVLSCPLDVMQNQAVEESGDEELPVIQAISWHSFGWVNEISVVPRHVSEDLIQTRNNTGGGRPNLPSLDITIRTKSQDLWHPQPDSIQVWTLWPEFSTVALPATAGTTNDLGSVDGAGESTFVTIPWSFPPRHQFVLPSLYSDHSSPRCRTLMLGARGTAFYVCSNTHASMLSASLIDAIALDNVHLQSRPLEQVQSGTLLWNLHMEALAAVVLPTSTLHSTHEVVDANADGIESTRARTQADQHEETEVREMTPMPLTTNRTKTLWSCADYDEDAGTVLLGSGDGRMTVLQLGAPERAIATVTPEANLEHIDDTEEEHDAYSWA